MDAERVINGDRSSWLTSDGEPSVAFDAFLQGRGHLVERSRQGRQVGVVSRLEPGVESAAGDRVRRLTDVGQRGQGPTAGRVPEAGAGGGRDQGGAGEDDAERAQGVGQLGQRDDLEVGGVGIGQGHADGEIGLAPVGVAHVDGLAGLDPVAHRFGHRVLTEPRHRGEPVTLEEEDRSRRLR